jgi:enediyne biosynthesis thioesterase
MFLREHVPGLLAELQVDLALVTLFCSCEYLEEIVAFDEILVRMTLGALTQSRMTLQFEYWRSGQMVAVNSRSRACGGNRANCCPRRCLNLSAKLCELLGNR